MLKRMGIPLVAVALLSGCVEQEGQVDETVAGVKAALTNAIKQIQQAISGEADQLAEQAKDAINEVHATANTNELIKMAGEQAVETIEELQKAVIEAVQEGKDVAHDTGEH